MGYIKPTDRKKPWALKTSSNKRELGNREPRPSFYVFCEGENTETEYFKSFPINTKNDITVIGLGDSKTSLVKRAIKLLSEKQMLTEDLPNFDPDRQLWVVFDYDICSNKTLARDFNNAIKLALQNGIRVAYSNDSFELWLVLHYQYQTAAATRFDYYRMLSEKLNCNYEKEGKTREFSKSLYDIFLKDQSKAIQHAHRLYEGKNGETFSNQNPCTTVFQLVGELNKCIRK